MSNTVTRLYSYFQPETYDLTIAIDETTIRFSGRVTVRGRKVGRPSQRLTFHANGLNITSGNIIRRDKKGHISATPVTRIHRHKTYQEVRLHTDTMLFPGEYTVDMTFEGAITDAMTGLYPCYYKEGGTKAKKLFATQFESHHAREVFPCIDEPEAKAVFTLTLLTREGIEVLSNMPVATQTAPDATALTGLGQAAAACRLMTTFQPTPKMSTYLLAFAGGALHHSAATTAAGTEVRVWGTTAQPAASFDYALDIARRCIEFFEDYFGVAYPLPKADHIALPDFSSAAMENWGLITYRERVLLAYPNETAQSTLEQIALVIAHETSHQWFGNLVTMKWWDDLWLNESFADIMEYVCLDHLFPEWHVWNSFVADEALSAFRRDAVAGVQAVQCDVRHPDEISTLFDPSIVYAKGGRLLYMLKQYVGEQAWRTGLTAYFTRHAYGNTTGGDLWASLSAASGKDVASFMEPWLTRSGFPVVHVAHTNQSLTLHQEHFQYDPSLADASRVWPVPTFANQPQLPEVFDQSRLQLPLKASAPVLINSGAYGHYIVDYQAPATQAALRRHVRDGTLAEPERLMLLHDNAMLARAGYQPYAGVLELLDAYANETSEPVWGIMSVIASEARRFIDVDPRLLPPMRALNGRLIRSQYARLGWEGAADESAADHKLRGLILGMGMYAQDEAIMTEGSRRFAAFQHSGTPLPPELRDLIMCVPVKLHDTAAFSFLLHLHDTTGNSELQADICNALTTTEDPEQAAQLLARLRSSTLVKPQDADRWLFYLLRNRYTRDTAWQWMVDNWAWIEMTYTGDKSYDNIPRYAASVVNTPEYAERYRQLFADKQDQIALQRNIQMGFAEIQTRLAWLERDLAGVRTFFELPVAKKTKTASPTP